MDHARAFLLLVGEPDDPVVAGVAATAAARSRACRRLGEAELLGATSFALRRTGRRIAGGLEIAGAWFPFADLVGVLLRPRRLWLPDTGFDPRDQAFVYHETLAAWISVLKGLACPVVNDLGLGWWLADPAHGTVLRRGFATAAGLPCRPALSPAGPDRFVSVHLVDGRPLPGGGSLPATLATRLEATEPAVRRWQCQSGARLLRADIGLDEPHAVLAVDPVPFADRDGADEMVATTAAKAVADVLLGDGR